MLFLRISIIFLAFLIPFISTFSWSNKFPNKCNSTCLKDYLKITKNDSDCLPWDQWPHILKPKNFTYSGIHCIPLNEEKSPIHVCPKIINGKKMLASCGECLEDFRISCIPAEESFEWYRGIKSTTFNGTKCLRWDEIDFIGTKFSKFFDFSQNLFESQTFGIHSHENFCRNPDGWAAGPWCYIKGGEIPERQPCFLQCKESEEEDFQISAENLNPCLSRTFLLSIASLKTFINYKFYLSLLPMKNRPKWISQYLIQKTEFSNSQHCYIDGNRANYFGPWTFALSPSDKQFRTTKTFPGDSDKYGDSWERCYFACEDSVLTCIPSIYFNYYGFKQITVNNLQCISPNILAARLQQTFLKFNNETKFKKDKPELWQFWKLFTAKKLGNVKNLFFDNTIDRLTNPQCFNFRWFIHKSVDLKDFYALKPIIDIGVGCFIAIPENGTQLTYVTYEPCFKQCPPNFPEPIFSIEPTLLPNETIYPISHKHKKSNMSTNFEEQLDTGSPLAAILLLSISCLSVTAAMIVCILHACNKI